MIERIFKDIPDGEITDADQQSFLITLGWKKGLAWNDLLKSKRLLLISEAGAGKTFECQKQARRMWDEGEPAFFVELAALAMEDLRTLLDADEEARLNDWLTSQYEVATFFVDSIDELKLTMGSFERALKRLKKCIGNQLHRSRIVITTRPIPFDKQVFRKVLPIPSAPASESDEETFAKIAMGEHRKRNDDQEKESPPEWRSVALLPLSDEQIVQFAEEQGVQDAGQLLKDLQRRNAQEFARRPQDLIELCADWKEYKRIRTHREQVATNIRVKLLPREDRLEQAELSVDKALEGASRLALAAYMTRRLTIRHSAASDDVGGEAALDPSVILSDWQSNERKALLERPIFGFASYGRVRFHHRSVAENLAAERLIALRAKGMPFRALYRLLFTETKGKIIVRPSKRAVAGWLALEVDGIFEILRENEPAVLLNEGDPESLTYAQRNQTLRAYAERYGAGGWRGLNVPAIQVHRFASKELAKEINQIWRRGVENPDVRDILMSIVEAGKIEECGDLVFSQSRNTTLHAVERISAIDALVAIDDKRLGKISVEVANKDELWPERVARGAILRLFPKYMSVEQFCIALRWIKRESNTVADFSWQLPRLITASSFDQSTLVKLRDCLVILVSDGLKWRDEWPHVTSDRSHLSGALAATCERGLDISRDDKWLYAGVLALRLHYRDHGDDEPVNALRKRLSNLNSADNASLFRVEDGLIQQLKPAKDAWRRYLALMFDGGCTQLRADRDLIWVCEAIGDKSRKVNERAMLLYAAFKLAPNSDGSIQFVEGIRPLIADVSSLVECLDDWLKPSKFKKEQYAYEKKQAKQKEMESRRKAKYLASWVQLNRAITKQPDNAFSPETSWSTAWNLWRAMSNDGTGNSYSGWNRRFIESHFDHETANKLRSILKEIWRNEHPTLPSERPEHERNTFLKRWQFGLAGIYAEAEDPIWATKLNDDEAHLAARYAQLEYSGTPSWMASLAATHPNAVDLTIGAELSWELSQPVGIYGLSGLIKILDNAPDVLVRLLLPRLYSWLDSDADLATDAESVTGMTQRIRHVSQIILKHGSTTEIENLQKRATQRLELHLPFSLEVVWMSVLIRINLPIGIEKFTGKVEQFTPAKYSEAVTWFASLFGDRQYAVDASYEYFTPQSLLSLLRLAYKHIRIEDDAHHDGCFTPDTRDDAERARNNIVTALFNTKGEVGLATKLEMATDPLCAHFKDRILAVAEERWAQEIDSDALSEEQVVALNRYFEAPASTNESMFAILKDRLSDLDDLLLSDVSPRDAWAGITNEKIMRREIARELRNASNGIYTVDQEAVTAEEKETDIRLRSVCSKHEAVIELKLGDGRSAADLFNTIENQLVRKYMAANHSKAGALLVTLSRERNWQHPIDKVKIDAHGLLLMLQEEAQRVQTALGGNHFITVHLLDLRPRLPVESEAKT